MKTSPLLLSLSLLILHTSCGKKAHDQAAESHQEHAAYAGHDAHAPGLLEVGNHVAHIDFAHDAAAGTVTLHVTGPDAKTARALSIAPKLNLTGDSPTQVLLQPVSPDSNGASAVFSATHDVLRSEPEGRIAVTVEGQVYQVIIEHNHDAHEGHDH